MLTRAWQNECDGWWALGQVPKSAYEVTRSGQVTYAWWEAEPGAIDNYVMIGPGYCGDLGSVLDPFENRIRTSQSKTAIRFVDTGGGERWARQAEALGFADKGSVPVMACALGRPRPTYPVPPEIAVREAGEGAAYGEAFDIVHAVFGGPQSITRFFNPRGPVRLYTGYWSGTPASSATVWPFAGTAGIYSVATLPEYRHRGLALATMAAQLGDAEREGFDLATLRTADELIPFYARLGFTCVGRLHSFACD